MPRYHRSSASSKSSYNSTYSDGSARSYQTDATAYSDYQSASNKRQQHKTPAYTSQYVEEPLELPLEVNPRSSVATYASTVNSDDERERRLSGPMPRERSQTYVTDALPSTSKEFASLFPSTRRLLIQHDDSTSDGNMNIRVDTEVTTGNNNQQKLTLFHLRMKNLKERDFSLRRYCRDSGREVASCKRKYVKSTVSKTKQRRSSSQKSLSTALHNLSLKPAVYRRQDSGYHSAGDEEDDRQMEETLNVLTAPPEQVIAQPTNAIRLEFSNYAQVTMERIKAAHIRGYEFEYWGDMYFWKREMHNEDGEMVVSYDLINGTTNQKMAIIMPDALSPQEEKWESKQGGWIPASSMRILRSNITDDLGDVIIATGLIALADDSIRQHFHTVERRR